MTIALAKGDAAFLINRVAEDVRWNLVGDRILNGKRELGKVIVTMGSDRVAEIIIHHVGSHGKAGAVNGVMQLRNGANVAIVMCMNSAMQKAQV